jgi:hypothetical protein
LSGAFVALVANAFSRRFQPTEKNRGYARLGLRNLALPCDIWNRFARSSPSMRFVPAVKLLLEKNDSETCFGGVIPTGKDLER